MSGPQSMAQMVPVLGAVAALLVVLIVFLLRRAESGARILLSTGALVFAALATVALLERMTGNERVAEQRALLSRAAMLDRSAIAPRSALACLDADAGDAIENACEKRVFASAESTAAAVTYMSARIALLSAAAALAKRGDRSVLDALTASRRSIELDRYGVAAHVLASRYGCTAEHCAAFAMLDDTNVLKANLKAQVFDQYVSRYAASWSGPAPAEKRPAISAGPKTAPLAGAAAPLATAVRPGEHWDFPSAASIPPVSIMNPEPPLPKAASTPAANTPSAEPKPAPKKAKAKPKPNPKPEPKSEAKSPVALTPPQSNAPLSLTR